MRVASAAGSDARLLKERYSRLGEAFLDGVEGRFAVALHDRGRGVALAARDGLGHASLCYLLDGGRFAVAGDESALLALPGVADELDPGRLTEFYANEELSGPRTFFDRIRAVLPGEMLVVEGGDVRRRALRRPRPAARLELRRFEDYVERFANLLERSVERCLRGTDRVAVLASGGLDSSPLAALAAGRLTAGRPSGGAAPPPVALLSWRLDDPAADERRYVEALARGIGAGVEWVDVADALPFSRLERWPVHPSTPEQTAYRWFHQRSYARAAELGHRVVLTGFGGDALYGNAARWWPAVLAGEGVGPALDRLRAVAREIGWQRTLRSHVLAPLLPWRSRRRRPPPAWLTAAARARLAGRAPWPPELARARRPRQAERLLALLDGHGEHVEAWYTAPFGLEQRTPLRDHDLVEFALAVPDHVLHQGIETRPVLRAAMRGRLPEEVRTRRGKADFRALLLRGLEPRRLGWAACLLDHPDALWRGHVEPAAVARWLDGRAESDAERIAYLHCLYGELWRERRRDAGVASGLADD